MGRDAAHEDDEDEKRKRHRFKRVPTRNGDAGALIYPDLASRFQNINVLGFSQPMFVMGEYERRGIFEFFCWLNIRMTYLLAAPYRI
jgi:hypothetical protein